MLLMDMKLDGGVTDAVNDGQHLIRAPALPTAPVD
jgi:hypothetical protein